MLDSTDWLNASAKTYIFEVVCAENHWLFAEDEEGTVEDGHCHLLLVTRNSFPMLQMGTETIWLSHIVIYVHVYCVFTLAYVVMLSGVCSPIK